MKKLLKVSLFILIFLLLAIVSLLAYFFILTKDTRLNGAKLTLEHGSITFYDNSSSQIIDVALDKDKPNVMLADLPAHVQNSFIAVEDKRFKSHSGIDYKRMVKSGLKNISSMSYKQGASTISQQLIKNTHLTNEKTIKRKLKEIKLAKDLEHNYSKDEIMELYLNSIYFGNNCFGIQNAAKNYFNKDAAELELHESAMLAAVIRAPSQYSPYTNGERCLSRRNFILKCMLEQGYIDEAEYTGAIAQPLPLERYREETSYYIRAAYDELLSITKMSPYALADGCKIYTYMDSALQDYITGLKVKELNDCCRTSVIIDNATNGISAYISSTGNVKRTAGSVIKPLLVYAPAIENNVISPSTVVLDEPTDFSGYSPRNYNGKYMGYVSAKQSLAMSLNIPAVKILNYTGIEKSKRYMEKMDVALASEDDSLAAALGGIRDGLPMIELTNAYSVFANTGEYTPASFIEKIVDKNGKVIYKNNKPKERVFSEGTAFLMNDMLMQTVSDGTGRNLQGFDFNLAAKTGTAGDENGNTDAYCISYTSRHTFGTWLGGKESIMPNNITGGTYPAFINKKIAGKLYQSNRPEDFFESNQVVKVKLDKISYETAHVLQLSDEYTPPEFCIEEYFKADNIPPAKSTRFIKPYLEKCTISLDNNVIKIDITSAEYYEYTIYRTFEGKTAQIYDSLEDGRLTQITDTAAKSGTYSYTVMPYIINGGKKLSGSEILLPDIKTKIENVVTPPDERDKTIVDKDDWWKD